MTKVIQEITSKGLQLPKTLTDKWGWHEGIKVVINARQKSVSIYPQELMATDIADNACNYLLEKVGDAVGIKTPIKNNGNWVVPVILPHAKKDIGQLKFTSSGELIIEESDSPLELLEKANED